MRRAVTASVLAALVAAALSSVPAAPAAAEEPDPVPLEVEYPDPVPAEESAGRFVPPAPDLPDVEARPADYQPVIGNDEPQAPEGVTEVGRWWTNPDGTRTAQMWTGLHFWKDASDVWHELDPTIVVDGDGFFAGTDVPPAYARFAPTTAGPVAVVGLPAGTFSISYPEAIDVAGVVDDVTSVRYPAALPGSRDLVLRSTTNGFAEDVVVPVAGGSNAYTTAFAVPDGITAQATGDGISFDDDAGETVATFGGGFAYDSFVDPVTGGPTEIPVNVALASQVGNTVTATVSIDNTWLNAPERVFPITIDPEFSESTSKTGAHDTFANSDSCSGNQNSLTPSELRVGYPNTGQLENCANTPDGSSNYGGRNRTRTFLKFAYSTLLPTSYGYDVTDADLSVYTKQSATSGSSEYQVHVNGYPGSSQSTTWGNQPNPDTNVIPAVWDVPGTIGWTSIPVTHLIDYQIWRDDGSSRPNYGLRIRASSETLTSAHRRFYAEEFGIRQPVLEMTYIVPPSAPGNVTLTAGARSATASWTRPTNLGGASSLSGYDIFLYDASTGSSVANEFCGDGCTSASFSGLTDGRSYYVRVRATNSAGPGQLSTSGSATLPVPQVTFSKSVGSVAAVGAVNCATTGPSTYSRGETVGFCIRIANDRGYPGSIDVSGISDSVSGGLAPDGGVASVAVGSGAASLCGNCSVTASGVSVGGFTLAPGEARTYSYPTVALGGDRDCAPANNSATATAAGTPYSVSVSVNICASGLGLERWWTYVDATSAPHGRTSVNVANGNLVVQQLDSTAVQARGDLAYVLRRTYNSQEATIATLPGSFGAGWRLNLGEAGDLTGVGVGAAGLYVPNLQSVASPLSVTLIDRDGTRHVFRPNGLPQGGPVDVTALLANAGARLPLVPKALLAPAVVNPQQHRVCVDQTYRGPAGVHLSLWRYLRVDIGSSCGAPTGAVVLGFAAERPDRLRSEFSATGALLSVVDANGVELRYRYEADPAPGVALGRLTTVYEPLSCADPSVATCRAFRLAYSGATTTVTDPAGRATAYLFDTAVPARLTTVTNPDGSEISYGYGGCGGNAQQLCSITDGRQNVTQFTYSGTAGPGGQPRVASQTDRRGTRTDFSYTTGSTSADTGAQRRRFDGIDTAGRVAVAYAGDTANFFRHETRYSWDTPGATCRQPDNVVDNNLCRQVRVSMTATTPDEDTSWVYNPEGQTLAERRANGSAPSTTTWGYRVQHVRPDGSVVVFDDTIAGSGNVTSASAGRDTGQALYVISDRTATLTPRGNAQGASVATFRTTYTVDNNTAAGPNTAPASGTCANPAAPAANTGNICEVNAPSTDGTNATTTRYTYDRFGQRTTMRTPKAIAEGSSGQYAYTYYGDGDLDLSLRTSASGWLKAVTDPDGKFVAFAYDRAGNPLRTWDRNATAGQSINDFPGTFATPTNSSYVEERYGPWSGAGTPTAPATAASHPWRYLLAERDQLGNTTSYTLDPNGNRLRTRPPRGNAAGDDTHDTVATYDTGDLVLTRHEPEQSAAGQEPTRHRYDAFGNQTAVTDPAGKSTIHRYDSVNRLTHTITPRTGTAALAPAACVPATTAETPIPVGRIVCTTTYTFDGVDNVVGVNDADGQPTTFVFDALHREVRRDTTRNHNGVATVRTESVYDTDGNRVRMCNAREFTEGIGVCSPNASHAVATVYNPAGLPSQTKTWRTAGQELTTVHGYDADGNLAAQTDANGNTTTWSYDLVGRKRSVTAPRDATRSTTTRWVYDPAGNVVAEIRPAGLEAAPGTDGDLVVDGTTYHSSRPYTLAHNGNFGNVTLINGAWIDLPMETNLSFTVAGTLSVCATCGIRMNGRGGYGGSGGSGSIDNGHDGSGLGQGRGGLSLPTSGGGGGGAGHFAAGDAGTATGAGGGAGGSAAGSPASRLAGAGGGGGGWGLNGAGGSGGNGGGTVTITAGHMDIAGTVTAKGGNGSAGRSGTAPGTGGGGGGGGAGGTVTLSAETVAISSTANIAAAGGTGAAAPSGHTGGDGAIGRVRINAESISGAGAAQVQAQPGFTHGAGRITAHRYDAAHRLLETIEAADSTVAADAGPTEVAAGTNLRTGYLYDADGNTVAVYDPRAFVASATDPDERFMTRTDYDRNGRPAARWVPRFGTGAANLDPQATQAGQCATGAAGYPSDTGVCVTRFAYDAAGNLSQVTLPTAAGDTNRRVVYRYFDDNLLSEVDAPSPANDNARVIAAMYRYDGTGQRVLTTWPGSREEAVTYTADDLPVRVQRTGYGAVTHVTTTVFDAAGQPTSTTDAAGHTSTTAYTADGRVASVTDGGGNTTRYTYDNVGNPKEVQSPSAVAGDATNPSQTPTVNTFTKDNLLASTVQPVAGDGSVRRRTTYGYDDGGRKTSQNVELVNAAGSPVANGNGGTQLFRYFPNDRLAQEVGRNGETISTTYDAAGNPTSIADSTSNVTVSASWYLDGLVREVDDGGRTTRYAYTGDGQPSARGHLTNGGTVSWTTYGFNDASLPSSMSNASFGSDATTWSYDPAGRTVARKTGAVETDWEYNQDDTLQFQETRNAGGVTARWDYEYDNLSRIVAQTFAGEGAGAGAVVAGRHGFTYDPAGRLATYTDGTGTKQVGFDANGNRTQYGSQTFAFNADDSMASAPGAPVFDYHPFGGLKSDGCRTYAFDGFDRMASTTPSGGSGCGTATATSYGYDGLDRQRTRTEGTAAAEVFQYDGLSTQPAAEVEDGRFVHYLLGPAGAPEGVRTSGSSTESQLLVDDGFGSVATAIDRTSGAVACTARFDAYGSPLSAQSESNVCVSGSTPNEVFFRGSRRDPATGQYQFGSRTYDPTKATFLTPDTYRNQQPTADLSVGTDPLTRNRYGYVNGDPVNFIDPDGHEPRPNMDTQRVTRGDRDSAARRQAGGHGSADAFEGRLSARARLAEGCSPTTIGSIAYRSGAVPCGGRPGGTSWEGFRNGALAVLATALVVAQEAATFKCRLLELPCSVGRVPSVRVPRLPRGPRVAPGGARVSHLGDDVARQVDSAIERAAQGRVRFPGHDGKVFENSDDLLPSASAGYYSEWTAAAAGAKRGAHRVIIGGNPARPDVIYYWDHAGKYVKVWP